MTSDWKSIDKALGPKETMGDVLAYIEATEHSRFRISSLGYGADLRAFYTEEERNLHWDIFGVTRTGKSKFIELLIRQGLSKGRGALLLDPTTNAETLYSVLKYALKIGYEKIILIDPNDSYHYKKVVPVNPLKIVYYPAKPGEPKIPDLLYASPCLSWVNEAYSVTWDTTYEKTTRISKFLPAVLKSLYAADMTLAETRYFMDHKDPQIAERRRIILNYLNRFDMDRKFLESAFSNLPEWNAFTPTVNQLNALNNSLLEVMFGAKEGLNFNKLVTEDYLILVNLEEGNWYKQNGQMLGTLILNECLRAIHRLRYNKWKGRFDIYIDECGDYANSKVIEILTKKAKAGVSLALGHTTFKSIAAIEDAVNMGTQAKVLFRTTHTGDRRKMLQMMYHSGMADEADGLVTNLPPGECIVKLGILDPHKLDVERIPDVNVSDEQITTWKDHYYGQPICRSIEDVRKEINARFTTGTDRPPAGRPKPDNPPEEKPAEPPQPEAHGDPKGPSGSKIFDHLANSPPPLRN